jgi:hypothetical protein
MFYNGVFGSEGCVLADNLYNTKTQVLFNPANYVIEVLVAFKKETP